jgi:hypothetical protein
MLLENIVVFIPLDTSVLDDPDIFTDQKLLESVNDVPIAANTNTPYYEFQDKSEDVGAFLKPIVNDDTNVEHPVNEVVTKLPVREGCFKDVYIQFEQCNKNLEWASSTNLSCRNCNHTFSTRPWYLPLHYDHEIFIVEPIFCSPGCVLRHNVESGHSDWSKRQSLFYLMYNIIYGSNETVINMAPKTIMLDNHGGPYTIDEYRGASDHAETVELVFPEIYSIIPEIRLIKRNKHARFQIG